MKKFMVMFGLLMVVAACGGDDEPTPLPPTAEPTTQTSGVTTDGETIIIEGEEDTAVPEALVTPTAPSAEPVGYTPEFVAVDECPFNIPDGVEVRCGEVSVPENRQNVDGRMITLPVAIFASQSDTPAADPVVYLEGGPGGYALETTEYVFDERIEPFLAEREFIVFDQRGTGYAEPNLFCTELRELGFELLDEPYDPELINPQLLDATAECRERLENEGVDLRAYNSAENAADVRDVRLALGYETWNLYGISYGTRLAQTVVRDYPEGVRAVILDSVYPLEVNLQTAVPENLDRAFDVFFAGCTDDPSCAAAYPNLEERFYALVETLNETPAEFQINYISPRALDAGFERYEVLFTGDDLIGVLFQSLYSNQIFPALPQTVDQIEQGNYTQLSLLLSSFLANGEFFSAGMYRSVQCREELSFGTAEEAEAAATAFDEYESYFSDWALELEACALWDAGMADAIENEPVQSDIPTLILTGTYDPITPPAWGEQVSVSFGNDYYFEVPHVGHGASTSAPCAMAMVQAFLADPTEEPESCLAEIEAPQFAGTAAVAVPDLVPFEADIFGATMVGVYPEGWEEAFPGTYTRGSGGLDQTAVAHQVIPSLPTEQVVALFGEQVGLEGTAEAGKYETEDGRVWSLYEASLQGLPVDMGILETDDFTFLVLFISGDANERELLYEGVFLPALEAYQQAN